MTPERELHSNLHLLVVLELLTVVELEKLACELINSWRIGVFVARSICALFVRLTSTSMHFGVIRGSACR